MWRASHCLPVGSRLLSTSTPSMKKHELFDKLRPTQLFDKVLVANRGEIAIRVMKTCRKLGIKTVAVHSEVDAYAQHVKFADEKVCIGPAPSIQSYLNADNILAACKETGAQAVHPGYGFLSEKSHFAKKLEDNGIVFVGPKPAALKVMGDKLESKKLAREAKVNTIPGYSGEIKDADHAVEIARQVGYPVMIKAAAGGGGKGMRLAWNDEEARDGFRFSKSEAKSSFGDDRLLVEKYIEHPRHIEIQLLGDSHGNAIYLNERECSIQRRNQKVIEEAPSTFLDPATRKAMGEQAVALAKAVKYESAGTVEFLVDKYRKFYFLEMNTRLQVEHPITEKITGVDIVEQMLRVAAGQPLPLKQSDIGINGWAMEARVYAEDPFKYLPSTGRLHTYQDPSFLHPTDVRVDSAVVEGSEISIYYDPMISKLVTHGKDRKAALELMIKALDNYVIKGVNHNIPLLRDILTQKRFVDGDLTTYFLPEVYPNGFQGHQLTTEEETQVAVSAAIMSVIRQHHDEGSNDSLLFAYKPEYVVTVGGKSFNVTLNRPDYFHNNYTLTFGDTSLEVQNVDWNPGQSLFHATVKDEPVTIQHILRNGHLTRLRFHGTEFDVTVRTVEEERLAKLMPAKTKDEASAHVLSPMPGTIISISVEPGMQVVEGAEVAVIEAMKMQNKLRAPRTGTVKAVRAKKGDTVEGDQIIIEFEEEKKKQ